MNYTVDINSDVGEGFGAYEIGSDNEIIKCVTSINIACGWHGGDPAIMDKTVKSAKERGVAVGAHPGYPDLIGFGRRALAITPNDAKNYVLYQTGALAAFAAANGTELRHVKLHGAFYNKACVDEALASGVLDAMEILNAARFANSRVFLMALSGSYITREAKRRGIPVCEEVFADRGYNPDGTLVDRRSDGAFIRDADEAAKRVIKMIKEQKVIAIDGSEIFIKADSICVHGDNPQAVDFAVKIRRELDRAEIRVEPFRYE